MRIIAGEFRGRTLASVGKGDAAAHLRPTSDRVRESLFSVISSGYGDPVPSARVLDLFAGTGALGLEALSRGAAVAVFVDDGRKALKLVQENVRICGVEDRARILRKDIRRLGANPDAPYDLVFLDPPYGKGLGEQALAAALKGGWIAPNALIIWEENTDILPPDGISFLESRRYGDTVINFCEPD